ncbi:hypothetical protein PHYBOEH_001717 [Phytophthora boehmeriae]|uniref:Uncharacterized protein n=1 Tax=Phytophthora boehmeriae TaxID=109152 RepID=A0A8T1WYK3_9STRA|nr:hypothetical protein PHYBOEH_001717 [Phytophthora boehmeriae]
MKPTPSVHPIDTLSKKLRQQAKELTQVYEELEKQNLQIDKYKRQIKSHKRELEQLRAQQAKAAENDSKARNSKTVALEQKKRAAQMMIGTPSTGASLGQKREELDRKLKDAERERKKYELAAKRIETALVDLRVFQNDRMENMLSGAKTSKPGQDATSANDLETVLNEQRAYIRVLEEAVHLKATEFEITGHEELLVVLAELRHTIYQQEKEVDEKNHAVAALQDQLELEQQNHAVTKELMATLQRKQEDAVQHSHEQESELHTQIDEMRSQLQRQEEQIRQFRDMSNDAQRSEETLQSRLNASAKSQNLTEAKLEDATRSIRALEDATRSIRALEEQLKAVSTQCEEAKHQAAGLKEECTKKQSHLDEMNALQEEMLGSVDEYAGKLKKAHEKVERLEEELEAYHQNEVRARKQMEEAERTADEKMKDLRSKIEAAEHQEQKVQAQCTALQHEKNQLESKLAEVQQNLEDQIQESSTQQQALAASESKCRQVEEMTVELEAALSTALQMMVEKPTDNFEPGQENQLGDGNSDGQEFLLDPSVLFELRLSANISQVEKSQQEQMDQIKTLQVQNSTFVTHFTRVVKQYLSFLRPIAATDRDLHDSLSQLKSGVENGDIAALLQLFPALVEEYIANCSAAHNQDVSKASKPIDNRKARKQKLQQVEVAVPKWQIPSDMELSPDKSDKQFPRAEEEESPFAEQLQLIRDAFQSYKR